MSENLDLVRSIFADWERGDFSSAEWADPEIEYERADGPETGTWSGLAGLAEGWHAVMSAWGELRLAADEYRALDGERVLVLYHFVGHGKVSGLDLRQIAAKEALLFHIRGGKVTRAVAYWDHDRALSDLSLEA